MPNLNGDFDVLVYLVLGVAGLAVTIGAFLFLLPVFLKWSGRRRRRSEVQRRRQMLHVWKDDGRRSRRSRERKDA